MKSPEKDRAPLLRVSSAVYSDESVFLRERSRISSGWQFFCHESELAPSGFLARNLNGLPLLAMKDAAGQLRVFENSCRHRGSPLKTDPVKCRVLRCPYHGWSYDLQGKCLSRPGIGKPQAGNHDLAAVSHILWRGMVWVGGKGQPAFFRERDEILSASGFGSFHVGFFREFSVACNWKSYGENILDSYHIAEVHKSFLSAMSRMADLDFKSSSDSMLVTMPIGENFIRKLADFLCGDRKAFSSGASLYRKLYLAPNLVINLSGLNATIYQFFPEQSGVTRVRYYFLTPAGFNPFLALRNRLVYYLSMRINREDNAILPSYHSAIAAFPERQHDFFPVEQTLTEFHGILRRWEKKAGK